MSTSPAAASDEAPRFLATLLSTQRITPSSSREEVRNLDFRTADPTFSATAGACLRVYAPGRFGNRHHIRLYSIADLDDSDPHGTRFTLCVRRCFSIDEVSGEEVAGVASNYLCDLQPGATAEFAGPVAHPFRVPADPAADLVMIGIGTGIAPFRGLIRRIYEQLGGWQGRVRLYYGARSGLEMLYMNDENADLANYYDQATFRAFQAVSPRPHFDVPIALEAAIERNATEIWEMVNRPGTQVFLAGTEGLTDQVDAALGCIAGSPESWQALRARLVEEGRWSEMLY